MLDILAITGPIYIAIALGFFTTRAGLFSKPDMRLFGKFVINLALPAILFNALAKRQIGEILNTGYLLAYLAGSLVTMGLGYAAAQAGPARCLAEHLLRHGHVVLEQRLCGVSDPGADPGAGGGRGPGPEHGGGKRPDDSAAAGHGRTRAWPRHGLAPHAGGH